MSRKTIFALIPLLLALTPVSAQSIDIFAGEETSLYSLDPATAAPTLIGDNGTHRFLGLSVAPADGTLWGLTSKSADSSYWIVTLNSSNGSVTEIVQLEDPGTGCRGDAANYRNLTVGTTGAVYVTHHFPRCFGGTGVESVDLVTGVTTFVANGAGGGGSVATRSSTEFIVTNYDAVLAVEIATDDRVTLVDGNNPGNDQACPRSKYDVAMIPGGDTAYFRGFGTCGLGMIDLTTGLISGVGATPNLSASSIAVPEPASFGAGFAAIATLFGFSLARGRSHA